MNDEPLKILLVDDDEDDFILTRDLLSEIQGEKYELDWVSTYDAGITAVGQNKHNVYLLDYRLGERNGLELLREAIAKGCKLPLILLTGQGDREVDMEAMKLGASDYLVKGEINAYLLERSIRYAVERKQAEEQILQMAYYDTLTKLPNRMLFGDRLKYAVSQAQRYKRLTAILFLDLDNFKRINDTLGHRVGDLLIKAVAERLTGCIRRSDSICHCGGNNGQLEITVARLGGDEFTILLTEINQGEDAGRVAQRVLLALSQPFILDRHEVFSTASIGIAVYPSDGENSDDLLMNADTAMYHAKEQGRNNYQFYKQSMNAKAAERFSLESDLWKALERKEFLLHYQPQIEISTGKVIGMEALIRWQHQHKGMISPMEFIPLTEETGLIIPIGEWVLHTACAQNKAWQTAGFAPIPVAVNLSCQQFKKQDIVKTIRDALQNSGMDPQYLILEITESVIMQVTETLIAQFRELTAMGIKISIDDFGTGYSSLSYLKRIPLSSIKIDRSFIKDVISNADDAAITRGITALAHSLSLKVIAEGVETEDQFKFLLGHGCDEMQGYLISKPLPVDKATEVLAREKDGKGIGSALRKISS